jgi:hypothetical protein
MTITSIGAAADYADAIVVARRAKNFLVLILLIALIGQITLFFVNKYGHAPLTTPEGKPPALEYFVGATLFLGLTMSLVLSGVLLLLVNILLSARLIGLGRMTSAFVWSLVLIVLLFPWQNFLSPADFKLPGVLYTWNELSTTGRIDMDDRKVQALKWARYAGFPAIATILLLAIQLKSSRGIAQAIGNEPDAAKIDPATPATGQPI